VRTEWLSESRRPSPAELKLGFLQTALAVLIAAIQPISRCGKAARSGARSCAAFLYLAPVP
jgi:hypothetical protein